ncbi:MAG: hypothetical protein ACP5VE_13630 [Chthonomonadales bacterium]
MTMRTLRNAGMALAGVAFGVVVLPMVAGCGHKEEAAPAGYYTGPIKPKGAPNVKGGGMRSADDAGTPSQPK